MSFNQAGLLHVARHTIEHERVDVGFETVNADEMTDMRIGATPS
jgi:hypothetical protein